MSSREKRMAYRKPERKKRSARQRLGDELKKTGRKEMQATSIQADAFTPGAAPRLSREIQNRIGDQLRLLYDQIVDEEIPQNLLEMLRRLEASE